MIKLSNINKYYNKNSQKEIHVLNNISINLPDKGFVSILGPSGCGKTTLLNVLGLIDNFSSGEYILNLDKFKRYNAKKFDDIRNQNIGFIFQNYSLNPEMTVYENLELKLNLAGYFNKEENARLIDKALSIVDLLSFKKRQAKYLSGGQKQRVGIARAIVFNPSIILADEPTGNLDSENTIMIMEILKELSLEKLVVLVTHEKALASAFSEKIVKMQDGKIISEEDNIEKSVMLHNDKNLFYLNEYKKDCLSKKNINVEYYNIEDDKKLDIIIFKKDNKLFIKVDGSNAEIIDEHSAFKLTKENRKEIILGKDKNKEYDLKLDITQEKKKRKSTIKNSVAFFEALKRVFFNRRFFGRVFIYSVFLIAFISSFIVAGIAAILNSNRDLNNYHKNDVAIIFPDNETKIDNFLINKIKVNPYFKSLVLVGDVVRESNTLLFSMNLPNLKAKDSTDFLAIPSLYQNETIKYGRKPQNENELVISSAIVDKIIKQRSNTFVPYIEKYEDILNIHIFKNKKVEKYNMEYFNFKIVGVTKDKFPYIYTENENIYDMLASFLKESSSSPGVSIESTENEVAKLFINSLYTPNNLYNSAKYNYIFYDKDKNEVAKESIFNDFKEDDILIRKDLFEKRYFKTLTVDDSLSIALHNKNESKKLNIKGFFEVKTKDGKNAFKTPNKPIRKSFEGNFCFLISNTLKKEFNEILILNSSKQLNHVGFETTGFLRDAREEKKGIIVSTKNKKAFINEFQKNNNLNHLEVKDPVSVTKSVSLQMKISSSAKLLSVFIILTFILAFNIFFIVRSSTIARKKEIMTMRLIGLRKKEISKVFLYEILIYFLFAFIPGFSIGSLVILGGSLYESFTKIFYMPFLNYLISLGIVLAIFIIIGIIPLLIFLSKTPAKIQSRYDY